MTPEETLAQALAKLQTANRIDGSRASYRKDNPTEYAKVVAYLMGSTRPSGVTSDMGMGLLLAEDARRSLVVEPPPPPPTAAFDWIGNTFSGENYNHVPHGANDLAVAPDGIVVTGANWIESGHEVKLYDATRTYGARSGLHDGIGARGVAITNTHVWAIHGSEIVRWLRSSFMAGDAWANRVTRNAGATLHGIAVIGNEVYVSDLTSIRVFPADLSGGQIRSFSASMARHLAADRQGNLWAIRPPIVSRYSPSGVHLASFTPSGYTVDIAADPNSDTILCCDNGPHQQIKKYSYSGGQTGTLGVQGGALAGPTPGLLGPQRLAGPRGVGVDAAGNVYVAQTGIPGVGAEVWALDNAFGRFLHIDSYDPQGTRRWRHEGNMFVEVGEPTVDGSAFYGRELAYDRGPDGRFRTRAFTLDPFTYPADHRILDPSIPGGQAGTTQVRDLGARRFLTNWGGSLAVFRMAGEIAVPAAFLSGDPGDEHIQVEGMPRENRPAGFPNLYSTDMTMDAAGNIWRAGQDSRIMRYRLQGYTAAGNPIYTYVASDLWNIPAPFATVRRIEVVGSSVYLAGYDAADATSFAGTFDDWKWIGNRIAKYPLPSATWPAPVWNVKIHHLPPATGPGTDHACSFAASGDKIAVGYQKDPTANSGYLRILSALNGQELRVIRAFSNSSGAGDFPKEYGEIGWLDIFRSLTFVGDMVWMEDDQLSKQVGVRV